MKESNISCTLCIVGAGYAGISALHAAKSYLKPEDKVIIIDEKEGFGGQWLKQYGFVRLHQPYRHFTAGNQSWKLKKKRDYLASKDEVISHLNDIAEDCSKDLNINALWRHRFLSYSSDHSKVEILAESLEDPNKKVSIRAEKLIHSAGFDIKTLNPLKISSKRVHSISVTDKKIISGQLQKTV